jgi:hypothetical protein
MPPRRTFAQGILALRSLRETIALALRAALVLEAGSESPATPTGVSPVGQENQWPQACSLRNAILSGRFSPDWKRTTFGQAASLPPRINWNLVRTEGPFGEWTSGRRLAACGMRAACLLRREHDAAAFGLAGFAGLHDLDGAEGVVEAAHAADQARDTPVKLPEHLLADGPFALE